MSTTPAKSVCTGPQCGCQAGLPRRDFLRLAGTLAAAATLTPGAAVAGPFTGADFEKLVPSDKKLQPGWLRSLSARGEPTVSSGEALRHIGMPVGGICAGQLYLGGDGKLWLWDIFNQPPTPDFASGGGPHYAQPVEPFSRIEQGFAVRVVSQGKTQVRTLDRHGFRSIGFRGQYPIGFVDYQDTDVPVAVSLEAFSPFTPLEVADSSLPATIMAFSVENLSASAVEVDLAAWLENGACLGSAQPGRGSRRGRVTRERGLLFVHQTAEAQPLAERKAKREDLLFDDFEKETYEGWTATGTAFGPRPVEASKMPAYQGNVGAHGRRLVNTHNVRHGEDVNGGDAHTGTLTSRTFTIDRDYITFLIGGGDHPGRTCMNLLVGGKVVLSASGSNDNRLHPASWDVRPWTGQSAQFQIVDLETGGWGNIGVDDIVFSDTPRSKSLHLEEEEDYGSLALALLEPRRGDVATARVECPVDPSAVFDALRHPISASTSPFPQHSAGAVGRHWKLRPGEKVHATFVLAWHFPAVQRGPLGHITDIQRLRRSYAARFASAGAVARHLAREFPRLAGQTRLWHRTWYDSSLPWWFLDRTFLNTSILATATCHLFDNGRFYGWEGTYCCAGTCQHVWQYAQAVGRIFPALERSAREMVDFGLAFHADTGAQDYRAEADRRVATDGQAGTILRTYREHQMSADDTFLRRLWPRVKQSVEYLIREDGNEDGMLEGEQYNTLDASWYGEIPWLTSLYLAAVRAGATMAREMGDAAFATRCDRIAESGNRVIVDRLFNGEYFIQRLDPRHPEAINTNTGCHIDQVYGQSWAFQVGLPRVVPSESCRQALRSLWRYNFTPDVGVYRDGFKDIRAGRWYAMPGEGGLLMCTWPTGGGDKASGKGEPTFVGYFNECMTGFEYQVAAHMVWEGLVTEGLAVTRMIHDRYDARRRNPWNEVECSDHYARAMASYGVYLAACGFEYHGPKGHLGFAPRMSPASFRAAFTAAEGWGSLSQTRQGTTQRAAIELRSGRLRLRTMSFELPESQAATAVRVSAAGRSVVATFTQRGARLEIALAVDAVIRAGEAIEVLIT